MNSTQPIPTTDKTPATAKAARTPRFAVGTVFTPLRKQAELCTVTDILTTRNLAGDIVKIRYVATHLFYGQVVTDSDVIETTIARGTITQP